MNKKQLEALDALLLSRCYDPNKEVPPDQIVIRIEGKTIASMKNFITITGMQKQGKGRYVGAMIAGAISRHEVFSMSVKLPEGKTTVALFDTEQSDYDFYKAMQNIKKLAKVTHLPGTFFSFNVREDDPPKIIAMVERFLILNPDCGLLVLDGITDMVFSYNDETESKKLVNRLKQWSKIYDCLIISVLHKGKSNASTLGHLGGAADRAAQSVLTVEKIKERGTFQLRADYMRSDDDFTPIEIYFEKHEQEWKQSNYTPPEEDDVKVKRIKLKPFELDRTIHSQNVVRIFNGELEQSYDMLVQNIREIYASGREWSKQCVIHLLKEGLVYKSAAGLYTSDPRARLFIKN